MGQAQIATRIKALQLTTTWTQSHALKLDAIDRDYAACRLQAEERSQPRHALPWSPTLHLAFVIHQYWTIRASALRRGGPDPPILNSLRTDITRLESTVALPDDFDHSNLTDLHSPSVHLGLRGAKKLLRHVNKQAQALRIRYLATSAELAVMDNDSERERILLRLQAAEERHQTFHLLQVYVNPQTYSSVTDITVPMDPSADPKDPSTTDWTPINDNPSNHHRIAIWLKIVFAQIPILQ